MRCSQVVVAVLLLVGAFSARGLEGAPPRDPSQYEENRLDRASQLALDASLSDIVLVATLRSVSTVRVPADSTRNAFLSDLHSYTFEVQKTLKGAVPGVRIQVLGSTSAERFPFGNMGPDASPMIVFLHDLRPLSSPPTTMSRLRSTHYQFMRYGAASDRGYISATSDSLNTWQSILAGAIAEQSVDHLATTAEVVLTATIEEGVRDCGLPGRNRYCQPGRMTRVYAGDPPDSLILVTSHSLAGVRKGANLLFLRRLQPNIYQVEGAAAGALWLGEPTPELASQLQRIQRLVEQRPSVVK